MYQAHAVVAMFCGPHDNDGGPCFRRINRAIEVGRREQLPVLMAGDANERRDLLLFGNYAKRAGVKEVYDLYDPGASTLFDARLVAMRLASDPRFAHVRRVHLVTDHWHMPRAVVMLFDQLVEYLRGRPFEICCENVQSGVTPPPEQLLREQRGIEAYLRGHYKPCEVERPYGKPVLCGNHQSV